MKKILILLYISFTFLAPTIVLAEGTCATEPSNPGEGGQPPKDEPVSPTIPEPKPK